MAQEQIFPGNVIAFGRPTDVSPYLNAIDGLSRNTTRLIINTAEKTSEENLAVAFHIVAVLTNSIVNPAYISEQIKIEQREGEGIEMSDEEIAARAAKIIIDDSLQLRTTLREIELKTTSAEYHQLLNFMKIVITQDEITISTNDDLELKEHARLMTDIGMRLSPEWRQHISNNPAEDLELARLMGLNPLNLDTERRFMLLQSVSRIEAIQQISQGKLSRLGIKQIILESTGQSDVFVRQRLLEMANGEEIPYEAIAETLRQLA